MVVQLGELTKGVLRVQQNMVGFCAECRTAMANHDRELALAIHVDILTRSSANDITLWMSGVKQLILRL